MVHYSYETLCKLKLIGIQYGRHKSAPFKSFEYSTTFYIILAYANTTFVY